MPAAPTLAELLPLDQHLEIYCCFPTCRRRVLMPAAEAVARLGPDCTFPAAARRLRCQACGARGAENWIRARPCSNCEAALRSRFNRDHVRRALRMAQEARGEAPGPDLPADPPGPPCGEA